jgi:hypothetical protein
MAEQRNVVVHADQVYSIALLKSFLWFELSTLSRESATEHIAQSVEQRYYKSLCKMGVLTAVKKNKIGAVVISVFDWYRTQCRYTPLFCCSSDHSAQHHTTQPKKRSFSESLILPF